MLSNRCCSPPLLWIQWAGGAGIPYSPLLLPNNCPSPALSALLEVHLSICILSYIFITIIWWLVWFSSYLKTEASKRKSSTAHHLPSHLSWPPQCQTTTIHFSYSAAYHPLEPPSSRLWSLCFLSWTMLPLFPLPISALPNLIFLLPLFCYQSS